MGISHQLASYMAQRGVEYDVIRHETTPTVRAAAHSAHVPERWVAKGVVYEDGDEYVMAVVPASRSVDPLAVAIRVGHFVSLANEQELASLFRDCTLGAVPPCGSAWNMRTIIDRDLLDRTEVWFEGGDHERLVHVRGSDFAKLIEGCEIARITRH